ncbi:unnamed protein product [Acidithrix sp. C25]|nr:unnamed protein product [Acidithrix sp. C25]
MRSILAFDEIEVSIDEVCCSDAYYKAASEDFLWFNCRSPIELTL